MPIYRESQIASINLTTPKVAVIERDTPPVVRAASTNVAGLVCQATRGDLDVIHDVGNISEFSQKLGDYVQGLDGFIWAQRYFGKGGGPLKVVRVASGAVAASQTLSGSISTSASGTVFALTADSVGTWGNVIKVVIAPNPNAAYFDITIRGGKNDIMSYTRASTLYTDDKYIENLINQDANKFVDITMIKMDGSVPLSGTYTLGGGLNGVSAAATGSALLDTAYIGTDDSNGRFGIQKFIEDMEVIYVLSARETTSIATALRNHESSLDVTARRTIYSLPQGTSVTDAITHAQSLDDDRVSIQYPLVVVRNPYTLLKETISSTPYAAAFKTSVNYNISMSQEIVSNDVIELEKTLGLPEVNRLTQNGINPIYKPNGRIIFGSDYTMSKNTSLVQDTVRRAKDFFGITFEQSLRPYVSKPINSTLWKKMKKALDTFLLGEWKADRIGLSTGGQPYQVVIDSSNNPSSFVALNRVVVDAGISLLGNGDTILVFMNAKQENGNLFIN